MLLMMKSSKRDKSKVSQIVKLIISICLCGALLVGLFLLFIEIRKVYGLWCAVAIVAMISAFLVCLMLFFRKLIVSKTTNHPKVREFEEREPIDFANSMSVFQARDLYNSLKKKCHPDRFIDPVQNEVATMLFQQISENQNNYKVLLQLKEQAIEKLNIII